jgi:phospholipid transport system transporter-binding protein
MNHLTIAHCGEGCFTVAGDLTFATIAKNTVNALIMNQGYQTITVDLSEVANTDSAGLALMIEWLKCAHKSGVCLVFNNIPKQLLALANLSGLKDSPYFSQYFQD